MLNHQIHFKIPQQKDVLKHKSDKEYLQHMFLIKYNVPGK